jgi:hypothetical protein
MTEFDKEYLRENGQYVPLYDSGDVLFNSDGTKVTIVYICVDQYRMKVEGEELDRYEFCEHVDYWFCPVKSLKEHEKEVINKIQKN